MSKLKVIIIGAGLGGLTLAQALHRSGVDVQIFERDASPWDRPQGYRLHLDADGIGALHEALPPQLYKLFSATSMPALAYTTIVDTGLNPVKRVPSDDHGNTQGHAVRDGGTSHINVNRATLRQTLLADIEDICHFGAMLDHYVSDADGVTAVFADGTRVTGDILVGADGIGSVVRKQRVPEARIANTGVCAIYSRIPIEQARRVVPQQALEDVFTIASDARKVFLGLGPVLFPTRPELASQALLPSAKLSAQDDYVVCIVGGRREYFAQQAASLGDASSAELQKISIEMLADWPEAAAAIPANGDPTSFFLIDMNTSVPCEMGPPSNVTLLGDAIHAMTPTLGRGANVAMRDAALLGRLVSLIAKGELDVADALGAYENEMTRYGFGVVRESALMGQRLMGQDALPE